MVVQGVIAKGGLFSSRSRLILDDVIGALKVGLDNLHLGGAHRINPGLTEEIGTDELEDLLMEFGIMEKEDESIIGKAAA